MARSFTIIYLNINQLDAQNLKT